MGLNVCSRDGLMRFDDRRDAGAKLGCELKKILTEKPVVLGIPRGGVVTAQEIAHCLGCDMDMVLVHKISVPEDPELALGAVDEKGEVILDRFLIESLRINEVDLQRAIKRQAAELDRRRRLFRSVYPKVDFKDRPVVVTDDGVATGSTVLAALQVIRQQQPKRLLAAFPVGAYEALLKLDQAADQVICLKSPRDFRCVSSFYRDFPQVTDEEVRDILKYETKKLRSG